MIKTSHQQILCIFFSISFDSAPLSASLLSDWSEVHRMTPADLESLQQELQLGSPMILSDTIPPDAWLSLSWDFNFTTKRQTLILCKCFD